MVNPIPLAVLSMLLTGISDFLYRRARMRGVVPEFFLVIQAVFFNATSLAAVAISWSLEISMITILFGFTCALLGYAGVQLFLRSLGEGHTSINVTIFRLSFIVTAIAAFIFLQETITFGKVLAIGLSVFSILALSLTAQTGHSSRRMMAQLIFATILWGLFGFFYKVAISMGATPTGLLVAQGAIFLPLAIIMAVRRGLFSDYHAVVTHAPVCGVLLSVSFLLLLESLKYGDVSVNFSIVQLSFVVTTILAAMVLHEKIRALNMLGVVMAFLAVMSFAYV
jgi:drug/metabolite transporter (DMT)-like permease